MQPQETEGLGLRLLKKSKKGILRMIFSRTGLIALLLVVQFLVLFAIFFRLEAFLPHIYGGTAILIVGAVLYLINSHLDPTAKITWLVVIMLLPVFGSLLYLFSCRELGHRALRKRIQDLNRETEKALTQSPDTAEALQQENYGVAALARYVGSTGHYPVFTNTEVTYFPQGEDKFQAMLQELEKAEKFIFLEYFIVEEGMMWGKILDVLARKAKQGVEVRLIYDGTCELALLPKSYPKKLQQLGIQCRVFAPVTPFVSTHYNYRDHRKILVIDGHTAFNGGVNLADEYINRVEKFGHWKDTAVMLKGEAVRSFTLMFLQMWGVGTKSEDVTPYLKSPSAGKHTGYVMPYGDCPLDDHRVGQQVYMDILNRAQRYVHIMTPYLILDAEMENALTYAARRGVEVTLLLPGIPDKRPPYALAKSHYKALLAAGVKIHEYTPGFVHAKVFVCDDREAVVGTINLDYRSLYHHFECATYLYGVDAVSQIEKDFQDTLRLCRAVTPESVKQEKWYFKAMGYMLKVFAPLL